MWARRVVGWCRKDPGDDFEWLEREEALWQQSVRRAIDDLERGMSDRSALLMPARLTPTQVAAITGVEASEIERRGRTVRERVARTLLKDEHRRRLAGSELTAYIEMVTDRMTRRQEERPPTRVEGREGWVQWTWMLRYPISATAFVVAPTIVVVVMLLAGDGLRDDNDASHENPFAIEATSPPTVSQRPVEATALQDEVERMIVTGLLIDYYVQAPVQRIQSPLQEEEIAGIVQRIQSPLQEEEIAGIVAVVTRRMGRLSGKVGAQVAPRLAEFAKWEAERAIAEYVSNVTKAAMAPPRHLRGVREAILYAQRHSSDVTGRDLADFEEEILGLVGETLDREVARSMRVASRDAPSPSVGWLTDWQKLGRQ